ncbi:MAG TPA: ATP-grasp domain-containing protein, partial [Planctomycetota bacterium]|nr:ATP-grasp domain-containing protein [Planctomycetota bacterium]
VKPALGKSFAARVYDNRTLREVTASRPPRMRVLVSEPVTWVREYRCFVLEGRVVTACAYRRDGRTLRDLDDTMGAGPSELDEACTFSQAVLDSVAGPPAFVLDVGLIEGRGWSVVEPNECWASGIYTCDRERVLATLLGACTSSAVPSDWDSYRFHREAQGS